MLRIGDMSAILSARKKLSSIAKRISIMPDLPKEEMLIESILLKENRSLIDSGTSRVQSICGYPFLKNKKNSIIA